MISGSAEEFNYTRMGGSTVIEGVSDSAGMEETRKTFTLLGKGDILSLVWPFPLLNKFKDLKAGVPSMHVFRIFPINPNFRMSQSERRGQMIKAVSLLGKMEPPASLSSASLLLGDTWAVALWVLGSASGLTRENLVKALG